MEGPGEGDTLLSRTQGEMLHLEHLSVLSLDGISPVLEAGKRAQIYPPTAVRAVTIVSQTHRAQESEAEIWL